MNEWVLGQWEEIQQGCKIREVPGRKKKKWDHEPDRRIELWAPQPIPVSMLVNAVLIERYALNEDRLFPLPHHKGGKWVYELINDIPIMGAEGAYSHHVERPRTQKQGGC